MNKGKSLLTRRAFGAVGLIGGGSLLLTGCTKQTLVIYVSVFDGPHGPEVPDISTAVLPGTTKIRFVSATPGWKFVKNEKAGMKNGVWLDRGPCIWRDGDGESPLTMNLNPIINNGLECEYDKVPKVGQKVNAYFCLQNSARLADTVETENGRKPRLPGDCGGGGELE